VAKHDRAGALLWARAVGGAGADEARALAVDPAGGVVVTGVFSGTVDFDPDAGAAPLTAAGGTDVFVLKLDAAGGLVWARAVGGADDDTARAVAIDTTGAVYVGGAFSGLADFDPGPGLRQLGAAGARDLFVLKLDAAGGLVWAIARGGADHEQINALAVDAAGEVFLAGAFSGTVDFDASAGTGAPQLVSAGGTDAFVAKFSAAGVLRWARTFGGAGDDAALSLAVGADGAATVAGTFRGTVDFDPGAAVKTETTAGESDAFVVRLDPAGGYGWHRRIGGTAVDDVHTVAIDADGAAYVLGAFRGTADLNPDAGVQTATAAEAADDAFVVKLAANGGFVWAKAWGGTGEDRGQGLAIDAAGGVQVSGTFSGTVDFDFGAGAEMRTAAGNTDGYLLRLTPAATIAIDTQAPAVAAIERLSPRDAAVTHASVTYRVRFTRAVTGVDAGS